MEDTHAFFQLGPSQVLDSVEQAGFQCTGRCLQLNSFENRVFEVEVEPDKRLDLLNCRRDRLVVKFYRPGRWSREQIEDEHSFLHQLVSEEIPVIAPLFINKKNTLGEATSEKIMFTLFPKMGGRAPEDLSDDQLKWLGRLLARIHAVGARNPAKFRIELTPETYGLDDLDFLLENEFIPEPFDLRYEQLVNQIVDLIAPWFEDVTYQRLHGDCHRNNLLWNDHGPVFLDFDDMVMGPPVQDIWLLLPGTGKELDDAVEPLIEGYEIIRPFERETLRLIEPLRTLRLIHYAAWIARRWDDPAFTHAFPHFGTTGYWSEQIADLQKQYELMSTGSF
jgi:Ser/Thr protein kinase RdoA (MazF antagonist)